MILLALAVFSFSTWAVFSHRFNDGLLVKHFLIFSAITAFIVVLDNGNHMAAFSSVAFLAIAIVIWVVKHHIIPYPPHDHKHRQF